MTRGRMFWGGLFILAGGLLLLSNLGWLPIPLRQLFWPLMLLLAGVWVLVRSFSQDTLQVESYSLSRDDADRVRLKLEHAAGKISIGPGAAADQILAGNFAGGIRSKVSRSGSEATVKLSVPSDSWYSLPFGAGEGFVWDLKLAPGIAYDLNIETAAGELKMDLGPLMVEKLRLSTGASSTEATLSGQVDLGRVKVESGVASLSLRVPEGVAARIHTESGLAQVDIDPTRFPKQNGVCQSPDYDMAMHRLDIDIETGVSSVKVS